jgi:hypothetical protein
MTRRYPITRHRELRPFLRWSAQRQRPLTAGQDEILVYRVGRRYPEYVAGTADLAPPPRATAVSSVDVRRDVPFYAGCQVAAANSWLDFPVTAYFDCTVISAVTVVRNRRTAAIRHLQRYLDQELAATAPHRAHTTDDSDGLRQAFTEALERRLTSTPIPGMRIVLTGLGVERAWMEEA